MDGFRKTLHALCERGALPVFRKTPDAGEPDDGLPEGASVEMPPYSAEHVDAARRNLDGLLGAEHAATLVQSVAEATNDAHAHALWGAAVAEATYAVLAKFQTPAVPAWRADVRATALTAVDDAWGYLPADGDDLVSPRRSVTLAHPFRLRPGWQYPPGVTILVPDRVARSLYHGGRIVHEPDATVDQAIGDAIAPRPTKTGATGWRAEYERRVAAAVAPEHAEHGLEPAVIRVDGADPSPGFSDLTPGDDGWISVEVKGVCPCGDVVVAKVEGGDKVAAFMRTVTAP